MFRTLHRAKKALSSGRSPFSLQFVKMCVRSVGILVLFFGCLVSALADEPRPRFGPYEAIHIDPEIVEGVRVDEERRIFLLLAPHTAGDELRLKISSAKGAGYRKWFTGEYEFVAPPNPDRAEGKWTDWIRTESPYIEYWRQGKLFLHLRRLE